MAYKTITSRARLTGLIIAAALLYGCASSAPKAREEATAPASPLSGMIGRHMVVFPAQYLATAGPAGTWEVTQLGPSLLPILDEEIADALRKRGVNSNWTFAREITQLADRNGGLAGDARQLSAQGIRRISAGDTPLPEPLASQIRTLVALTSARFAMLPIETHLDTRNGERKGTLRMLLIDSRTARVLWAGDVDAAVTRDPVVVGEAMTPYGFRLLARDLAARIADLVVAQ
jgi:hypothetical protein